MTDSKKLNRRFAVAPMLKWTDRHARYFLRLISPNCLLYTEMITTGALIHGDRERYLAYHQAEHPVALQLAGSNIDELAQCAQMAQIQGYDEVNLNVGCPSDRVQSGRFGACLMAEPILVGKCVGAMQAVVDIPVTVKCRIGIDNHDSYEELQHFINIVASAGCNTFIIHARKAILQGLSPKENRDIPPLQYDLVYRVKQDFPELCIIINGGISSIEQCQEHLLLVDGVMVGREAYQNPYLLTQVEQTLFESTEKQKSRSQILLAFLPYVQEQLAIGVPLNQLSRHILGLFQGTPGAKQFRRHISENAHRKNANITVLEDAYDLIKKHQNQGASE